MSRSYKLTESSIRSINRTIRTVNQMRTTGPSGDLPFRQNQKRQPGGTSIQIGKTTAEWTKGTEAKVNLYSTANRTQLFEADGVTPRTASVFNLFADVGADKWVAFMNGILIAAECNEE
jgi:hypothetical protein